MFLFQFIVCVIAKVVNGGEEEGVQKIVGVHFFLLCTGSKWYYRRGAEGGTTVVVKRGRTPHSSTPGGGDPLGRVFIRGSA